MDWLRLHVSNLCNFKCPNCHVFELGENNLPSQVMSQEIFNQSIDQYLNVMSIIGHRETIISLYGGETLANKKVIKSGIERYGRNCNGIKINWVINTNGSLLKEDDIIFFKQYNVEIHISVDGMEEIHNLSRPTHKGKGTFSMIVPALDLIKKHEAPAQINSYMMPSNYLRLTDIVDIAVEYGIEKIYLDQFYNLEMISHQVGMQVYRKVFYYGIQKGVQINGPWRRVINKFQNGKKISEQLEKTLAVDVNVDGSFYFPVVSESKKETRLIGSLTSFFEKGGWKDIVANARKKYEKTCDQCSIKDHCFGSAIEQVHYHVGIDADTEVSCNFFRDWCSFLLRPLFYKQYEKLDLFSLIVLPKTELMVETVNKEIDRLEQLLWPLDYKIHLSISEYPEEFRAISQQHDLPSWVIAVTAGDRLFYHLGTDLTSALIHELTHLFIAQKKLKIPIWFVEGICEWIQNAETKDKLLKVALKEHDLMRYARLAKQENRKLILIDLDQNIPTNNLLYVQAKEFVRYFELLWGRDLLIDFLKSTAEEDFEVILLRMGKSLQEHWNEFTDLIG